MKIGLLHYGLGNVYSMENAIRSLGYEVLTISSPQELKQCQMLVLPGVGAFGEGMAALEKLKLDRGIKDYVEAGGSLLGVCLGMQLLFEESEEFGTHQGLGLVKGKVQKLPASTDQRIPNIGWRPIALTNDHPIQGLSDEGYFYFNHSYYPDPKDGEVLTTSNFGSNEFCSGIMKNRVIGTQYHPEKSGPTGLRFLQSLIQYLKEVSLLGEHFQKINPQPQLDVKVKGSSMNS